MHRRDRGGAEEFQREIAVRHRIERVCRRPVEAQRQGFVEGQVVSQHGHARRQGAEVELPGAVEPEGVGVFPKNPFVQPRSGFEGEAKFADGTLAGLKNAPLLAGWVAMGLEIRFQNVSELVQGFCHELYGGARSTDRMSNGDRRFSSPHRTVAAMWVLVEAFRRGV